MDRYKVLGKLNLVAISSSSLYEVPLPTVFDNTDVGPRTDATVLYTIVSSIIISNQLITPSNFSIAVLEDSSTTAVAKDWIFKATEIGNSGTMVVSPGITLPAIPQGTDLLYGASLWVLCDVGNVTVQAYGVEVTQ
tara:strand:- start:323 stop:730 length:408 start_codon:yes stop_codon:yes gene_type:complete